MGYAVCTSCSFLRAFSARSNGPAQLTTCPACGGQLQVHDPQERFQPAYIGRVAVEIHAAPPLRH